MKRTGLTVAVMTILVLTLTCAGAFAAPVAAAPARKAGSSGGKLEMPAYKPGQVLVVWKDTSGPSARAHAMESAGVESVLREPVRPQGTELLKLAPGQSTQAAVESLRSDPGVASADFNWHRRLGVTPPSPDFTKQWGLNNTGQTIKGVAGTYGSDIDATEAWEIEYGNSSPTVVAVIDSGIDLDHPNLDSKLWTNTGEIPDNDIDDDANTYVDDYHGYNWAGISNYAISDDWELGRNANNQTVAQQFKARADVGDTYDIGGLEILLYGKVGNPTANIVVSVRDALAGPDLGSFTITPAQVGSYETFNFIPGTFGAPVSLTAGTDYYYVITTTGVDWNNYYYYLDHTYDSGDPSDFDSYVEGKEWIYYDGGWHSLSNDDIYFKGTGFYYNRDDNGHGTHCAGIVGAESAVTGSVGVAYGNNTKLMALKAGDASGSLFSDDWMDAIDYASAEGADIISMSFGGEDSSGAEQTVVSNAYDGGATLFASSGNSYSSMMQYPAGYDDVIGVGATDNKDARAAFSTYNSSVDVSAPGKDYYSTMPTYPVSLNQWYASNYDYLSGTSMACPCAAGVAALVKSKGLASTPSQVQTRVQNTADDLGVVGKDTSFGYGRVNACRALDGTPTPVLNSLSPTTGQCESSVTVLGNDFGNSRGASHVDFGSITIGSYTSWRTNQIVCKVPLGLSGPVAVRVVTAGGITATRTFDVVAPATAHWYLAEGTSDWGFDTYINIENPNTTPVTAQITYMTKDGPRGRPDITLPALSQTVVNPRDELGATDFSTEISCAEGKTICVDRRMIWTGQGAASQEGHSSVGVTSPSSIWYLAEGSSKWGFETWLLIQNPNPTVATCSVTYMTQDAGPVPRTHTVPPNTRASFSMGTDIGERDASIKVHADVQVIAERAMYRNNRREGHDSIGTTEPAEDFFLAEGTTDWGFTTYVLVQNPNDETNEVSIYYMTPTGLQAQAPFIMQPNSRETVCVNNVVPGKDLSIQVSGTQPLIAERAMYWDKGSGEACHDSIGMEGPHTTFYLPDGEAQNGYETWTLVQNPNIADVLVDITYLTVGGQGNVTKTELVPAYSRRTFNMAEHSGIAGRASIVVTCTTPNRKVMVERAMYWNNRGAGTDTIGGFTD